MNRQTEQNVVKKKGAKEWTIIVVSVLLAVVMMVASLAVPFYIPFALIIASIALWFILGAQNVEFEYTVSNGEFVIERIVAQRRRKCLASVKGHKVTGIAPYTEGALAGQSVDRLVTAVGTKNAKDHWYFTYVGEKGEVVAVVFQPNYKTLAAVYRELDHDMKVAMQDGGYDPE